MVNNNLPHFVDKTLICSNCEQPFIFEVGEQVYFLENNLSIPKRCPACRSLRKLGYPPTPREGDS